jgi:putative flippase GtrA
MSALVRSELGARWWKFSVVGLLGVGVQLAALSLLVRCGLHYLLATAIAVEIAILHNYAWHRRWTWAERAVERPAGRLFRFHLANGLVSLLSNLLWMRLLVGMLGIRALPGNLLAIGATSLVNFALGERCVFRPVSAGPAR